MVYYEAHSNIDKWDILTLSYVPLIELFEAIVSGLMMFLGDSNGIFVILWSLGCLRWVRVFWSFVGASRDNFSVL